MRFPQTGRRVGFFLAQARGEPGIEIRRRLRRFPGVHRLHGRLQLTQFPAAIRAGSDVLAGGGRSGCGIEQQVCELLLSQVRLGRFSSSWCYFLASMLV